MRTIIDIIKTIAIFVAFVGVMVALGAFSEYLEPSINVEPPFKAVR